MMDIVTKRDYWTWLDAGLVKPSLNTIKNVQDAFILSRLASQQGLRVLEIGGGDSRVLRTLADRHECWMLDKLEGVGEGPREVHLPPSVRFVKANAGEFSADLPEGYFDCVFSISVIEHVTLDLREAFFADCARVMKPGAVMLHAVDHYIVEKDWASSDPRLTALVRQSKGKMASLLSFADRPDLKLRLRQPPAIDANVAFSCRYASNPDSQMYAWNKVMPQMLDLRAEAQSVSIKAEWIKTC